MNLMHALFGNPGIASQANGSVMSGALTGRIEAAMMETQRKAMSKKIFDGRIEVSQVANGFVVNIGKKEGYEYETHIAHTIKEVNEIIAAQIVAFRLEDK